MAISIEIQDRGFLDLFGDVQIPITLSVSDIGDIGRRQGARSTSFEIPRTSNNEEVLDYVSSLTYDSSTRNKNIPCNLWENGTLIKKGFLSITGISESIKAVFFGDNVDWFKEIDGKLLTDIIFPSEFNHIWNETNVVEGGGRLEGYFYHLHSPNFDQRNGNNITGKLDKSRPATFLHSIFTSIFDNINVKLEGNLLKDPFFKKIVLPFNKKKFALTARSAKARQGSVYLYSGEKESIFSTDPNNVTYMKMDWGDSDNPDGSPTDFFPTVWDNTNKIYTVPFTDTYTISCNIKVDLGLHSSYDLYYQVKVNGVQVREQVRVPNDNYIISQINCTYWSRPAFNYKSGETEFNSPVFDLELSQGDELEILVGHSYDNTYPDRTSTCSFCTGSTTAGNYDCTNTSTFTLLRCQQDTPFIASILQITPSRGDYEGGTEGDNYKLGNGIDLASTLPDISQKDLVSYVFNSFGVIPEYDIFSNTLTVNKYEDLQFNKNIADNWSGKVDFTNSVDLSFNSIKDYAKRTFFKYSQNNNIESLKNYNVNNGIPYGSGFISIDNDFLQDDKTVYTAPFSSPVIDQAYGNISLDQDDEMPIAFISSGQRSSIKIDGNDFSAYDLRFDTTQGMPVDSFGAKSLSFDMPVGVTSSDTGLLANYYGLKARLLNKPVLLKILIQLTEVDIVNLDFNKPKIINLEGRGSIFY